MGVGGGMAASLARRLLRSKIPTGVPLERLNKDFKRRTLEPIDEVCKDQTIDVDKIATPSNQIGSAQP